MEADLSEVVHLLVSTGPLAVRCGAREQHTHVTTVSERVTCAECRRLARQEVDRGGR